MLPCFVLNRFNHVYAHVLYVSLPHQVKSALSSQVMELDQQLKQSQEQYQQLLEEKVRQ